MFGFESPSCKCEMAKSKLAANCALCCSSDVSIGPEPSTWGTLFWDPAVPCVSARVF